MSSLRCIAAFEFGFFRNSTPRTPRSMFPLCVRKARRFSSRSNPLGKRFVVIPSNFQMAAAERAAFDVAAIQPFVTNVDARSTRLARAIEKAQCAVDRIARLQASDRRTDFVTGARSPSTDSADLMLMPHDDDSFHRSRRHRPRTCVGDRRRRLFALKRHWPAARDPGMPLPELFPLDARDASRARRRCN